MRKTILLCGIASLLLLTMSFVSAAKIQTENTQNFENMQERIPDLHSLIKNENAKYWSVIFACFIYYAIVITYFLMK